MSDFTNETIKTNPIAKFKEVKVMTFCGLMAALAIVLGKVATIKFGPYIKVGFSGLPNRIVDYLFGPVVGAIFGGALDIIKWFLSSDGNFFIGFTISAMTASVIYGLFLYKKPVKLWRVVAAELCVKVFCNVFLNTLWLNMLYGKAISAILPGRILSNFIMLPIDSAILFMILTAVSQVVRPHFDNER